MFAQKNPHCLKKPALGWSDSHDHVCPVRFGNGHFAGRDARNGVAIEEIDVAAHGFKSDEIIVAVEHVFDALVAG